MRTKLMIALKSLCFMSLFVLTSSGAAVTPDGSDSSLRLRDISDEVWLEGGGGGYSWGPALTPIQPQRAMGEPLNLLSTQEVDRFWNGKAKFLKSFTEAEGLGPRFNSFSCLDCHQGPHSTIGGAHNGLSRNVTRYGYTNELGEFDPLSQLGGSLLQTRSTLEICQEFIPPEANTFAQRRPLNIFGDGLLEAVSDTDIARLEQNPPLGLSGRVHAVTPLETPGGATRAGRFGWKAQSATVKSFMLDAAFNELGITSNLVGGDDVLCDTVADPEDPIDSSGVRYTDAVTDFMRFLAAPPQTPKSGMYGEAVFKQIGCADCHLPSFVTKWDAPEAALSSKTIKPYSDFLIHYMGELGDGISQGSAGPREMRTAPLWGFTQIQMFGHDGMGGIMVREETPYMHTRYTYNCLAPYSPNQPIEPIDQICHDQGESLSGVNLVLLNHGAHGSEARPAAQAYFNLGVSDQQALQSFLMSLGRREFDYDDDNQVLNSDFQQFLTCAAANVSYSPNSACSIFDINQDHRVDVIDLDQFIKVYTGAMRDCNCNGIPDLKEIFNGSAQDANHDGSLDQCLYGGSQPLENSSFMMDGAAQIVLSASGSVSLSGVAPNKLVKFYLGYGEGLSYPQGDALCLNITSPTYIGSGTSQLQGLNVTIPYSLPLGLNGPFYIQAFISDANGSNLKKTPLGRFEALIGAGN